MSKRWNEIGAELLPKNPYCLILRPDGTKDKECTTKSTQGHHGIIGRDVRFEDWIDHWVNWCPSCSACNVGKVGDSFASRMLFLQHQIERGYREDLSAWFNAAPDKMLLDPQLRQMKAAVEIHWQETVSDGKPALVWRVRG